MKFINYTFIIATIASSASLSHCTSSFDLLHSHTNLWNAIMPTELASREEKWV
jgi:hypothetical protein